MSSQSLPLPKRLVELEVDGQSVRVFDGQTILDALRKLDIETPTLCYGDTLQPANACRICVVEVEGARAPAFFLGAILAELFLDSVHREQ